MESGRYAKHLKAVCLQNNKQIESGVGRQKLHHNSKQGKQKYFEEKFYGIELAEGVKDDAYKDEQRGTWYVSFHYTDWTGKNKRKLKRGFKTRKEALEWENSFRIL